MELITEKIECYSAQQLPSAKTLENLPRHITLELHFKRYFKAAIDKVAEQYGKQFTNLRVTQTTTPPILVIIKPITTEEIDAHLPFFHKCTKDYQALANKLIKQFTHKYNCKLNSSVYSTLHPFINDKFEYTGVLNKWMFRFHGFGISFKHTKTKQYIQIPYGFGTENGMLDPFFFSRFMQINTEYKPLPVPIYHTYIDAVCILERMATLGMLNTIENNAATVWVLPLPEQPNEQPEPLHKTVQEQVPAQQLKPEQPEPADVKITAPEATNQVTPAAVLITNLEEAKETNVTLPPPAKHTLWQKITNRLFSK